MAKALLFLSIIFFSLTLATANYNSFSRELSPKKLGLKKEKLSHLHFYFHDIVSGRNPTAVQVAEATMTNKSLSAFGLVRVMDDPLTLQPELSSKFVGRAQGIYAFASQTEVSLLMALNFFFTEGKYNGSTLSVLGRNSVLSGAREMPIIGGNKFFRFARGYAQARTYRPDMKTDHAVIEYNVYVLHH